MSNGIIGFDAYEGLFTKAQFNQGKGRTPGSVVSVRKGGDSKEFVAVKLASGTWSNGCLVRVDSAGVVGTATTVGATASAGGVAHLGQRLGLLVFSTVSALQTMAGTAFGYAQVFGQAGAQVVSATVAGMALGIGGSAGILSGQVVQASATGAVAGIQVVATASTQAFSTVFLNYPKFVGGS
jgi:hypothetical protein